MGGETGSFLSDAGGTALEQDPSNEWEGGENVLREKVNLPSDPLRAEPRQAVEVLATGQPLRNLGRCYKDEVF